MPNETPLRASKHDFACVVDALLTRLMAKDAPAWEREGRIPRSVWKELGENDLFRLPLTGPGVWRTSLFLERLGYFGYGGIRSAIGVAAFMAPYYIEKFGSPELKSKYLPAIQSGDCVPALAISEAGCGSDLRKIGCIGELAGVDWLVVNGKKDFIANGRQADVFLTLVKTDKSVFHSDLTVSSFVAVDQTPGCVSVNPTPTLGWKSADVCQVRFNRCYVSVQNILGRPNMGMVQLLSGLDFERLVAGTLALGGARRAITEMIDTAVARKTRGRQLGSNQSVSHAIANHVAMLRMLESFNAEAWKRHALVGIDTETATTLKLQATELEMSVAQDLLRFNGASGFDINSDSARFHRDAVAGTIAAGPSEILRDIIYNEQCNSRALSKAKPPQVAKPMLAIVAGE